MSDSVNMAVLFGAAVLLAMACGGCTMSSDSAGAMASRSGPGGLLWVEGESFVDISKGAEMEAADRAPASGGRAVYGGAIDPKGNHVTYRFTLAQAMPSAKLVIRYARLHWRDTMVPAPFKVALAGSGDAIERKTEFPNTGGWGTQASHFGLVTVDLGNVAAGEHTLTLTSLADNNSINVDGFFVAPGDFQVKAEELSALGRIQITSQGYLGLRSPTLVRQTTEPWLWIGGERFGGGALSGVSAVLTPIDMQGKAVALKQTDTAVHGDSAMEGLKFALPDLPDGQYALWLTSVEPACKVKARLTLAGRFLADLDANLDSMDKQLASLKAKDGDAAAQAALADLAYGLEYLRAGREKLAGGGPGATDPWKAGLAYHEGGEGGAAIDDLRKTYEQSAETLRRLAAGEDPYAGRSGDLRRALASAVDGRRMVYRLFVPSSYWKAEKVPLILFLHGGGGDENYWPDMEGGAILRELERRGYMALMPHYHTRRMGPHWQDDLLQLVAATREQYPKIDPARLYVTGISMGGFGTYSLTTTHPDVFAAAVPISGTGRPDQAVKLKTVPTLIIHGGNDTVVSPETAKATAAKLKELGYDYELHIYPTFGHGYHVDPYLDLTLDWFDRHRK